MNQDANTIINPIFLSRRAARWRRGVVILQPRTAQTGELPCNDHTPAVLRRAVGTVSTTRLVELADSTGGDGGGVMLSNRQRRATTLLNNAGKWASMRSIVSPEYVCAVFHSSTSPSSTSSRVNVRSNRETPRRHCRAQAHSQRRLEFRTDQAARFAAQTSPETAAHGQTARGVDVFNQVLKWHVLMTIRIEAYRAFGRAPRKRDCRKDCFMTSVFTKQPIRFSVS